MSKTMRLKRESAGRYKTADGLYSVWQTQLGSFYENHWYVNLLGMDETLFASIIRRRQLTLSRRLSLRLAPRSHRSPRWRRDRGKDCSAAAD